MLYIFRQPSDLLQRTAQCLNCLYTRFGFLYRYTPEKFRRPHKGILQIKRRQKQENSILELRWREPYKEELPRMSAWWKYELGCTEGKLKYGHLAWRKLPEIIKPHPKIFHIHSISSGDNLLFLIGRVNKTLCSMIIDTGANVTIIRTYVTRDLGETFIWTPPCVTFQTVHGYKIQVYGKVRQHNSWKNRLPLRDICSRR